MWETFLGGLLAILGGWGAIWYQLRSNRKNRMDEVTAERKVTANAEAYAYTKEVQSSLTQTCLEDTRRLILNREEWFFNQRLFLPGHFPAKWLSVRNSVQKLILWQSDKTKTAEEKTTLHEQIKNTTDEAIDEIYKDMNLERIELNVTSKN